MKHKVGLMFGVFDGLHPGHHFIINEALGQVEKLYIAVASNEAVKQLKSKSPMFSIEERQKALESLSSNINAFSGDTVLGTWSAIKKIAPDVIFLGYDQEKLKEAIERDFEDRKFEIVVLPSFEPETFHSSILNK